MSAREEGHAATSLGSAALDFVQLRVPRDEHEAFEMLLFWTRNTVEQIKKSADDGWSPEGILAYAGGDLKRVLSFIDRIRRAKGAASSVRPSCARSARASASSRIP